MFFVYGFSPCVYFKILYTHIPVLDCLNNWQSDINKH